MTDSFNGQAIDPGRIRFLTFNTWGLKYIARFRKQRLTALAERLAGNLDAGNFWDQNPNDTKEQYDVVALQEVWCDEDWNYIVERCKHRYPYYRRFKSGMISGPGLAILSKIPIESTFLYRFPINGRPSAFWRGDWYVGKSISVTLLKRTSPEYPPLAILNSHMHAPYALTGDAAYECHRACQSWDFSKLVKLYKKAGYSVVVVGDLNSRPGSLPHKFLTIEAGQVDSWEQKFGVQDLKDIAALSPANQITYGGTTCDSTLNTWRASRGAHEACRLDYALIDSNTLHTLDAKVTFTETIPNIGSFSDHFAYSILLQLKDLTQTDQKPHILQETDHSMAKEQALERIQMYDDLLLCIDNYMATAKWQKLWRGTHFWVSIFFIIASMVVTTFTSNIAGWSSIFWILFSVALTASGLIDGLISLLFGNKEIRALQEVYEEVSDAKRFLSSSVNN
ncbi:inositol phosphosphingolipid phospholipase [Kluyveromyces lactis]|uniref:KLLA0C02057p n=1 Tax=Kluyveromyces lactis (strain ATCC 8585 / CBS 2359 / DSM 70799 / NBRC 1267 / NRRL Y-1140 / WM37) TaxID=284590 RepID=Q6CUV1_KLULA|nr:uncharacterized protein KLLA0_C02057g [Kluyveromyces lactis]CAH01139.1 KLLA0C02057p [Kluyveromyces lactis]|eukprot:XP_452288.1 uncharacterized protein KLLA0_C02057g [Kluyveromyces lactis]